MSCWLGLADAVVERWQHVANQAAKNVAGEVAHNSPKLVELAVSSCAEWRESLVQLVQSFQAAGFSLRLVGTGRIAPAALEV